MSSAGFAGLSAVSALPHFEQNLAPARLVAPQEGQQSGRGAPQVSQKLLSSGVSEWQLGHCICAPCSDEQSDYCSRVTTGRQANCNAGSILRQPRPAQALFVSRQVFCPPV